MQAAPDLSTINENLIDAPPQTILRWAVDNYAHDLAIVTSFQPSGLVMLHMLSEIAPTLTVLTLDTGLLFPETDALIERWRAEYAFNVVRVRPAQTVSEQGAAYGDALWATDPDRCCHLRKTVPLGDALRDRRAWITGIRRDQSAARKSAAVVSWDSKYNNVKLAPLATWTEDMVWTYIHAYELPYNPLHDRGYASIGCATCTRPVAPGEDARAGRWSGSAKTECGIHVAAPAEASASR